MDLEFTKYIDLSRFSPDEQALFVGAMSELVMARMASMVGDYLTEAEIAELEQLSSQADGNAVIAWLNVHIPNFAQGIDEILAEESAGLAQKVSALAELATTES